MFWDFVSVFEHDKDKIQELNATATTFRFSLRLPVSSDDQFSCWLQSQDLRKALKKNQFWTVKGHSIAVSNHGFAIRGDEGLHAIQALLDQDVVDIKKVKEHLQEFARERQIHIKAIENLALNSAVESTKNLGLRAARFWNVFAHSDSNGFTFNDPQKVIDRVNKLAESGNVVLSGLIGASSNAQPSPVVFPNRNFGYHPRRTGQSQGQGQGYGQNPGPNRQKQRCFNYNFKAACSFGAGCKYAHFCLCCWGPHAIIRCQNPEAAQKMVEIRSNLARRSNRNMRRR